MSAVDAMVKNRVLELLVFGIVGMAANGAVVSLFIEGGAGLSTSVALAVLGFLIGLAALLMLFNLPKVSVEWEHRVAASILAGLIAGPVFAVLSPVFYQGELPKLAVPLDTLLVILLAVLFIGVLIAIERPWRRKQ